ncbi:MAG TPA: PIN domain-containing protein, partial [Thermoanaerobaculia bacterium]|nr:PIN domain-containing protein [Thermoanaerobaculia bacterium]
ILPPGPRHLDLLDSFMRGSQASGKLSTDAHLAALAIEHQAELHTNDGDFAQFSGLRWTNPLQ